MTTERHKAFPPAFSRWGGGGGEMKKPKPKERKVAIRVRVKPSVKAMAERLAQKDARSMADWLERLIASGGSAGNALTKRKGQGYVA